MRTWNNCGANGSTVLTLSVAPEGRECVVVLQIRTASEAGQHILDTLEVSCGGIAGTEVGDRAAEFADMNEGILPPG